MTDTRPIPPYEPELVAALTLITDQMPQLEHIDDIPALRVASGAVQLDPDVIIGSREITHAEHTIRGYQGDDIVVSVFARADHVTPGPAIYHAHGGGMIGSNRFLSIDEVLNWVEEYDAVAISVEYRLAPEHPDPTPIEDCYAGLVWLVEHSEELGIDPSWVMVAGTSAGGGLAAGTALLARDRNGPAIASQLLMSPMLDDRNQTVSSRQFVGIGLWDRLNNEVGWTALLGDRRGTDEVSVYASPSRAEDLSGLPPTFIDVGSAEVFRDEDVAYASRIWECGGTAELHVWAGGFHGFDKLAPHAAVSASAIKTREAWVARQLSR